MRMGRGADIEIFGSAAEQQIAYAAADEVSDVIVLVEPIQHFERVGIVVAPRDGVCGSRHDGRLYHRRDYSITTLQTPLKLQYGRGLGQVHRCATIRGMRVRLMALLVVLG